jgi:hypothetical protein
MRILMDRDEFEKYLKKGGRSVSAINRCIHHVSIFEDFLRDSRQGTLINDADLEDLSEFIRLADQDPKIKLKTLLWAIRYYYNYTGNLEMCNVVGAMREERIIRKPFPLKDFRGVDIGDLEALAGQGITNTVQMLQAGATQKDRRLLAEQTGIPEPNIVEFVKLSDLARIPGVKGTRARLYYEAGIDSVAKIANLEPENFLNQVVDYVNKSGFDGVPTLPAEAVYTVEKARKLPDVIDYDPKDW